MAYRVNLYELYIAPLQVALNPEDIGPVFTWEGNNLYFL